MFTTAGLIRSATSAKSIGAGGRRRWRRAGAAGRTAGLGTTRCRRLQPAGHDQADQERDHGGERDRDEGEAPVHDSIICTRSAGPQRRPISARKRRLVQRLDAERPRLLELAAGVGAHDQIAGLLADRADTLPPSASIAAAASSRVIAASVPVSTNVLPASGPPPAAGAAAAAAPRFARPPRAARRRAARLRGSSKTRGPTAATTGPISGDRLELRRPAPPRAPRSTRRPPPAPAPPARRRGGCRARRPAARARSACSARSRPTQVLPPTSRPHSLERRELARALQVVEVGEVAHQARSRRADRRATRRAPRCSSPRRDAKCSRPRRSRAGHDAVLAAPDDLVLGPVQRAAADRAGRAASPTARRRPGASARTGSTTFGMTSPPFSMRTRSPSRMSLRAIVLLVVQRRHRDRRAGEPHRLEHGVRRHRAGAADVDVDPQQPRRAPARPGT